jgi:hypothetical protein
MEEETKKMSYWCHENNGEYIWTTEVGNMPFLTKNGLSKTSSIRRSMKHLSEKCQIKTN